MRYARLLQSIFNSPDLPRDLAAVRCMASGVRAFIFNVAIHGVTTDQFVELERTPVQLPYRFLENAEHPEVPRAVMVEDETSGVLLYDNEVGVVGLEAMRWYFRIAALSGGVLVHPSPLGHVEVTALERIALLDWGFVSNVRLVQQNPRRYSFKGGYAGCYQFDTQTGALREVNRNAALVNDVLGRDPKWVPFGAEPAFRCDPRHIAGAANDAVIALEQYTMIAHHLATRG